jgi:hypothetical protein
MNRRRKLVLIVSMGRDFVTEPSRFRATRLKLSGPTGFRVTRRHLIEDGAEATGQPSFSSITLHKSASSTS